MSKIKLQLFFFCVVASLFNALNAQDSIPLLKGNVNISILKGTIACDLELSNIPPIEDYVLRLNSGMNIINFRNVQKGNLLYFELDKKDTTSSGESLAYYFPGPKNKGKFLPEKIHFRYLGMFPVIRDSAMEKSVADWRGNLAFNGYSLRVDGFQSAWYPILYDMKKQKRYEDVKYNITINCEDCNTLYINGSKPAKGKSTNFVSDIPRQLTLFCGNYETAFINGTYILNPDFDKEQQLQFAGEVNSFKKFYQQNLDIPYKGEITFIQTTPTAQDYGFLFVSYPTIANVGAGKNGLKAFFNEKDGNLFKPYIAHELGHYYFGTLMRTNSSFGPIFNEGFTEYLSFKATKKLISDSVYNQRNMSKIRALNNFTPAPFSQIRTKDDFENRELYVYYYVPLLLTAVEKEIGEKMMWKWLKTIIETKTELTDYTFLEKTLLTSIQDKVTVDLLNTKYFETEKSLQNVLEMIGKK